MQHELLYPHQDLLGLARASRAPFDYADQFGLGFLYDVVQLPVETKVGAPERFGAWALRQEFKLYNGHDEGWELLDKTRFSSLMEDIGYLAPRTTVVRPGDDPASRMERIAFLAPEQSQRFLKPRFGRQAKGTMVAETILQAHDFSSRIDRPYLVQTLETSLEEWRYAVHRDRRQIMAGEPHGWRLAFQKYRPYVTGDGKTPLGELVRDNPRMKRASRIKLHFHKGMDLDRIPAAGEHVEMAAAGNIGARLPNETELANLDRFMGRVVKELEGYIGEQLATICFDIGMSEYGQLAEPYDHEELRKSVMFYEYQVPFGFFEYSDRVPRLQNKAGKPEHVLKTLGRALVTHATFTNSLYVSGKAAAMQRQPKRRGLWAR